MNTPHFDAAAHARAMREQGFWRDTNYDDFLMRTVAATPDKLAVVAYRADREGTQRFSYRAFADLVARVAASLRGLGVGPGDIVALQVPNWWEFVVTVLATNRIGAVVNPLMPIFRERELSYMLGFAQAKVLVVPRVFRGFDHEAMARDLRPGLPDLKHVIVIDGQGDNSFDKMLLSGADRLAPSQPPLLAPDAMAVMMFTSGTTGSPKGVMHSTNTLVANSHSLSGRFGLTADDVLLACSPLGHMTGYAAVLNLSLSIGGTMVLQDVWEVKRGVAIMADEGVTYTAASTPFLSDIVETVAGGAQRPARLRSFLCGGAPIPPVLIERAKRELGLTVCSLFGMTEALSATLTEPARAHDKSATTDGRALEGVGVKVVDEQGHECPRGTTGRLLTSGAQMFLGYFKRPDIESFDDQGWFDTGDLAYMDDEGYIRINGRTKDVLIRGGENVPVVEIEALLYQHPAVAVAALVGYPDARLGERGCACVTLRPGASLTLAELQAYMAQCKVAKNYWPERLEIMPDMPRTPAGKIQKFKLREMAAGERK